MWKGMADRSVMIGNSWLANANHNQHHPWLDPRVERNPMHWEKQQDHIDPLRAPRRRRNNNLTQVFETIVMLFTPTRHTREGIFVNEISYDSHLSIRFHLPVWYGKGSQDCWAYRWMAHRSITHHPLKHSPCIPYPQPIRWNHNVWIGHHSYCNMESMWLWDIKQKVIWIEIDYWMVEWMCVYVPTVWHYWLSQNIQKVSFMNIDERHTLSHAERCVCGRSRVCWWTCYRASWTCNCFHCCWICTTLIDSIYFGWFRS